MTIVAFIIAVAASVIGGICGIGGGILMKPLLDMLGIASVSTISFLSGLTVLSMSGYTTARNFLDKNNLIRTKIILPLAIGAAIGGIAGKLAFETIKESMSKADSVGAVQAVCLALISIGTAVYTINKRKIKNIELSSPVLSMIIGIILGVISSFLGIGGGPINIPVLIFFFSMDSKTAAQNSLFIIVVSQLFSLIYSLISKTVPEFEILTVAVMALGGISGGMIGKKISKKISNEKIDKLFICLMAVIVVICFYNYLKFI